MSLRRKISTLRRRRQAHTRIGGNFFKLLIGPDAPEKYSREVAAESFVRERWFWLEGTAIVNKLVMRLPGLMLLRAPRIRGSRITEQQAFALAVRFFNAMEGVTEWRSWRLVAAQHVMREVWPLLPERTRLLAETEMGETLLPVTGCHGDLGAPNLVVSPQGLYLIDWEDFRADGSFVEDLCRLIGSLDERAADFVFPRWSTRSAALLHRAALLSGRYSHRQFLILLLFGKAQREMLYLPPLTVASKLAARLDQVALVSQSAAERHKP